MIFKRKQNPTTRLRIAGRDQKAVFSYYSQARSDNQQNIGRGADSLLSKSHSLWRRLPTYLAGGLMVIAVLYSLWLKPSPRIVIINYPNTINQSAKVYQTEISGIWRQSLLNQSKLSLNSPKMIESIRQRFPELANVQIELPLLGSRASVVLTPSQPAMELISSSGSFFLDSHGKILAESGLVQTNRLKPIPLVEDDSDLEVRLGQTVLPQSDVTFLRQLYSYLRSKKLSIDSMNLSATAAHQVDVRLRGQPYFLKFSLITNAREAVGTYLAAKKSLARRNITPNEYMDLRVSEKVFYK